MVAVSVQLPQGGPLLHAGGPYPGREGGPAPAHGVRPRAEAEDRGQVSADGEVRHQEGGAVVGPGRATDPPRPGAGLSLERVRGAGPALLHGGALLRHGGGGAGPPPGTGRQVRPGGRVPAAAAEGSLSQVHVSSSSGGGEPEDPAEEGQQGEPEGGQVPGALRHGGAGAAAPQQLHRHGGGLGPAGGRQERLQGLQPSEQTPLPHTRGPEQAEGR